MPRTVVRGMYVLYPDTVRAYFTTNVTDHIRTYSLLSPLSPLSSLLFYASVQIRIKWIIVEIETSIKIIVSRHTYLLLLRSKVLMRRKLSIGSKPQLVLVAPSICPGSHGTRCLLSRDCAESNNKLIILWSFTAIPTFLWQISASGLPTGRTYLL